MKLLITHDIIDTIKTNEAAGNITLSENRKLRQMTLQLYRHQKYDEMEKEGVNALAEEALILDIDIIEQEHKKELLEKDREIRALQLLLKGVPDETVCSETGLSSEALNRLKSVPR